MARRLPPLNALRAFEAAARNLSFTEAAAELFVTQGAISRQIKALEDHYGFPLFRRGHRQVALTEQGRLLLPAVTEALDRIARVSERLVGQERELKVKVLPTMAVRWVIPRLHRFQAAHPEIEVRLTTAWHFVDFAREDFDAGVVYSGWTAPGVRRDAIFVERMTPVCAPALLETAGPLKRPEDLKRQRLILNTPTGRDWRRWAEVVGVTDLPFEEALVFDMDDPAIRAAAAGAGVGLGDLRFVEDDLATGRLIAPLEIEPVEIGTYYLAAPESIADAPRVAAFRDWLVAEVSRGASDPAGPPAERDT